MKNESVLEREQKATVDDGRQIIGRTSWALTSFTLRNWCPDQNSESETDQSPRREFVNGAEKSVKGQFHESQPFRVLGTELYCHSVAHRD